MTLTYPARWVWIFALRETLRAAERLGLMDTGRGLGGQIMGYNYYRHPDWVHVVCEAVAAAIAVGTAFVLSVLVARRMRGSSHATICGACGGNIDRAGGVRCENGLLRCPICRRCFSKGDPACNAR